MRLSTKSFIHVNDDCMYMFIVHIYTRRMASHKMNCQATGTGTGHWAWAWDWGLGLGTGIGEWEWGMGNGEWGMGNGKMGNGKIGNREYPYSQSQEMTV